VETMIGCLPTQALAFFAVFVYATHAQRKRLRLNGNRALLRTHTREMRVISSRNWPMLSHLGHGLPWARPDQAGF